MTITKSKKEKIIKKAENLFSRYNYNAVSLNDIAQQNKVTKAALYYHFKNKEDLFLSILKKAHKEISFSINKIVNQPISTEEKVKKIILTVLDTKINQNYLTNLTVQKLSKNDKKLSKLISELKEESLKVIEPLMKEIIKSRNYPQETDPKILSFFIMSSLKGYTIQKTCDGYAKWPAEQFANEIINIIFRK